MICPFCKKSETKVIDKRDRIDSPITRRRRECLQCKLRFTTYERVENLDLEVIKKSGRIEPFNRDKLKRGLQIAIRKHISEDYIIEIVDRIESKLSNQKGNRVSSAEIGNMVLDELKKLDKLSYLRFASVYKDFKSLEDFTKEITNINNESK